MTISGKSFTAVLLLFFLFPAPNTAEINSPMIPSHNQSCPLNYPIEYSLLFENCNPQYNSENYYSTGLTHLSYIYLAFSFVYFVSLGVWISICLKIRPSVRRIHFLMAGLIVIKGINLIFAADERYYEKVTGSRDLPDLLIYVQQCINALRLLILILLIGIGWPLLKPCLEKIDEVVFRTMIPLWILAEAVSIAIGENVDTKNWNIWNEMVFVVEIISPHIMMIHLTFTLPLIPGRPARVSSRRLELVRTIYGCVSLYLMATKTFTLLRMITVDFKLNAIDAYVYLLKSNAAEEVTSLVFHILMFKTFKNFFEVIEYE